MSGRKPPSSKRTGQASKVNGNGRARHSRSPASPGGIAELGKEISRAYQGRRLDVVITLDRGLVLAMHLILRAGRHGGLPLRSRRVARC